MDGWTVYYCSLRIRAPGVLVKLLLLSHTITARPVQCRPMDDEVRDTARRSQAALLFKGSSSFVNVFWCLGRWSGFWC